MSTSDPVILPWPTTAKPVRESLQDKPYVPGLTVRESVVLYHLTQAIEKANLAVWDADDKLLSSEQAAQALLSHLKYGPLC
jgi:hypothetical protein